MKVVINRCFGGFGLSKEAYEFLGLEWDGCGSYPKNEEGEKISRNDVRLVECVEKLGKKAAGFDAELKVVEIPDDVEYEIDEYDGQETIHEKHRMWY